MSHPITLGSRTRLRLGSGPRARAVTRDLGAVTRAAPESRARFELGRYPKPSPGHFEPVTYLGEPVTYLGEPVVYLVR
jgi:hypothetical protein